MKSQELTVENPLSLRLLKRLLLFSALFVVVLAGLRAHLEYNSVLDATRQTLDDIGNAQAKSLGNSLWDYDREDIALHLEGICNFPYITYAAVLDRGAVLSEHGTRKDSDVILRETPLVRVYDGRVVTLGTLAVQADLAEVRSQAYLAALKALAFSSAMVALVALALFLLTRGMISRHLAAAAAHFQSLRAAGPGQSPRPLTLDKKPAGDELDLLAHAVNVMQENLVSSHDQTALAQQEAQSMARFPEQNPNPVLRVSAEGLLLVANPTSKGLLKHLGCQPGYQMPAGYVEVVRRALISGEIQQFEASFGGRSYAFTARPIEPDGFVNIYGMDITRRIQAEEEIQRNMVRLQCLVRVLQFSADSVGEFLDGCLAEALVLTESHIGYIYHYDENTREFALNSWSREVMQECTVESPRRCYALQATGIWGEVVRQRAPVVINDFQAEHPLKRGYPEGHVELTNFMSVPVLKDGRIVAVAGVGNKAGDYSEADVLQLSLLMDACWQVVVRMEAEQSVLRSLREKEILLKEIHHRVKNNLQIISSLLFLQMQYVSNPDDKVLFVESQKRIQAMALVHEELYGDADLSGVDMREYAPRLVERVAAGANIPVSLDFRVADVRLPVTRSIPCGLLLNELVMNAVKHAFQPGGTGNGQGLLKIGLEQSGERLLLSVEDNGPGLPPDFDISAVTSLGMTLVVSLAAQLGGQMRVEDARPGARFSLDFPLEGP